MDNNEEQRKKARHLLKKLDETIEKGPWDKSIFLGVIGKKLKDIRFNFKNRLRFLDPSFEEAEETPEASAAAAAAVMAEQRAPAKLEEGYVAAFVALYNADGASLPKWEKILVSLDKQVVTRPVYGSENAIRAVMRSKTTRYNDAYAAFFVKKEDIVEPAGASPLDRLGNPLLILQDSALKVSNITRFHHTSGVYQFRNNTLVRVGDVDFNDIE